MESINIAIIGIGRIAQKYLKPINQNPNYKLVAVCDIKKDVKELAEEYEVSYYSDYLEMINDSDVDLIVITTPPETHFHIAMDCIKAGKSIIVEKPAVLNLEDLEKLEQVSKEHKVDFDVIFHWKYGNEVSYLQGILDQYGPIKKIEVNVYDPYTDEDYQIKEEYVGLTGTWYDSGVNCLSFLSTIIDVNQLSLVDKKVFVDDNSGYSYYSKHEYCLEDIEITISVDWRYNMNHKYSRLFFEKDVMVIDHSKQSIFVNNQLVAALDEQDRLETHYHNYFKSYATEIKNINRAMDIHRILFKDR